MIFHHLHRVDDHVVLFGNRLKHLLGVVGYLWPKDLLTILRNSDEMILEIVDRVLASSQGTHALTVPRFLAIGKPAFLPPASWGASSGSLVKLPGHRPGLLEQL
jgi:hypothetical protein